MRQRHLRGRGKAIIRQPNGDGHPQHRTPHGRLPHGEHERRAGVAGTIHSDHDRLFAHALSPIGPPSGMAATGISGSSHLPYSARPGPGQCQASAPIASSSARRTGGGGALCICIACRSERPAPPGDRRGPRTEAAQGGRLTAAGDILDAVGVAIMVADADTAEAAQAGRSPCSPDVPGQPNDRQTSARTDAPIGFPACRAVEVTRRARFSAAGGLRRAKCTAGLALVALLLIGCGGGEAPSLPSGTLSRSADALPSLPA